MFDLDPSQLELLTLRAVVGAVRDGLSLDGAVEFCLDKALEHLRLDFGCLYVRRHDYLIRIASRGLGIPSGPGAILPLDEARWAQRPFVAHQGAGLGEAMPEDVGGKAWFSLPLRIGNHLAGVLLLGGYGIAPDDLPPLPSVRRVAEHLAVAIDNAERFGQTRAILNDTRDIIFRTDAQGRFTYLNSAWEETFGEPLVVALSRRVGSYVEPAHRRKLGTGLEALVPRGGVIGRQTLPFVLADGKCRWMDVQARLVRDDRGHVIGSAGVMRDVSLAVRQARDLAKANQELRERAEALERANRELAALDKLKSAFLATVSHELRTPLATLIGYAEMLQDGIPDEASPGQQEYLGYIMEGAGRLHRLIDQLLDLARIEGGALDLACVPVALDGVLREAVAATQPLADTLEVTIELLAPAAELAVTADPERLGQVVAMLLENAVKFNRPGGHVRLRVDLRPDAEPLLNGGAEPIGAPHYAQIAVDDDGIGISPESRSRLFRKFQQADGSDTREHGGLGVGLVIGKALVELMGGRIELYSPGTDAGTTVGFTIPLSR